METNLGHTQPGKVVSAKHPLIEGAANQIRVSAKSVINMLADGVRIDHALSTVKKASSLGNDAWGMVVELVQRSLQVYNYNPNNKVSMNGLGNPAVAAVVSALAPVMAEYAFKKMSERQRLGAIEVLNQNSGNDGKPDDISFDGKPIYFNGFKPTYTILPSYDNLISRAHGNNILNGNWNDLDPVLEEIKTITKSGKQQILKLAAHLFDSNELQAAFNVWHFLKMNVGYSLEPEEQLRTPARTWKDRFSPKCDCDDLAIFSAAVLSAMGYKPAFAVVAFNGKQQFQHIYTVIQKSDTVIDAVMDRWNEHPKNITKMKVWTLNGIPGDQGGDISGLSGMEETAVQQLHANRAAMLLQKDNPSAMKELRKINFVLSHQGRPHFAAYYNIMKLIDDVDSMGRFTWVKPVELFSNEDLDLLERVGDSIELGEIDEEIENDILEGLGKTKTKLSKAEKQKIQAEKKTKRKALAKQRVAERKEANKGVSTARKIGRAFARVEPLMASGRSAFLLLTNWNFRGLAANMSWGVLDDATLKKNGLNATQIKNVKAAWNKLAQKWADIGGNPGKLRDSIKKGMKKKPLFGGGKKAPKQLKGLGTLSTLEQDIYSVFESVSGLGIAPAAIAAYATAAAAVIGAIGGMVSKIGQAAGKSVQQPTGGDENAPVEVEEEVEEVESEDLVTEEL